ncbi:MAG: NAD-dependent epimerase/dehydratase family protein [Fervidobacterium sp.]|uniref:dTDP-glucose 4,6-dehydratase n=1 Tax=Fervidobacterium gondwanense DSM 13020 TaxID=1121883 RepID=A0A1M7THY6_FERGO|nr:NAD-dependent epimerase/dehydratase family protein [Fervidobacterium gondwanense]UXF01791.1 epimerase [Fervidobacterium riparium]SHN70218.1 dTDP-glucose 4,6-dehydratase [Fervidobacterium gondwanense DSM 13020]
MIRDKVIFVTGGAGFIGWNTILRLCNDNKIIIYDNMYRHSKSDTFNLNVDNISIIKGDILDYELLYSSIPENTDIVLHFAAIAGVDTVLRNPVKTMEINTIGTYFLLKVVKEKGLIDKLHRLVFLSTSEVFGVTAFKSSEDTSTNLQPVGEARWVYSVSKVAGEHLINAYNKEFGLRSTILRPFNVYGPGQIGEGAIHQFVVRAIKNEPLQIHGDGTQIRSWCYIDDMVDGILLSLENDKAIGEVFNIGNPRGTLTILSLAEKVIYLSGSSSPIIFVPKNYIDVELRIPNIEKAQRILNYNPKVDLNEGLLRTIEWYKSRINKVY